MSEEFLDKYPEYMIQEKQKTYQETYMEGKQ